MRVTIDRFDGIYAVCEKEDRTMIKIKKSNIPNEAKEGDIIDISNCKITINIYETNKKRDRINELLD